MIAPGTLNPHILGGRLVMNLVISANTADYNLRSAALAAGWDTITPLDLTCTVNSGVTVFSTNVAIPAFDVGGPYPTGTTIHLVNNGVIAGKGGRGGDGGNGAFNVYKHGGGGQNGGPALTTTVPILITNNGTIGGGGGGGAGAGATYSYNGGNTTTGIAGSAAGGGQGNGDAGSVGPNNNSSSTPLPGTNGTLTAAGIGGNAVEDADRLGTWCGKAGDGGTLGMSGTVGINSVGSESNLWPNGAPGSAGPAVNGNANITWLVTGTRLGALA